MSTAIYEILDHKSRMKDLVLFAAGIEFYLAETAIDGGCRRPGTKCEESFAISQTAAASRGFLTGDDVFEESGIVQSQRDRRRSMGS